MIAYITLIACGGVEQSPAAPPSTGFDITDAQCEIRDLFLSEGGVVQALLAAELAATEAREIAARAKWRTRLCTRDGCAHWYKCKARVMHFQYANLAQDAADRADRAVDSAHTCARIFGHRSRTLSEDALRDLGAGHKDYLRRMVDEADDLCDRTHTHTRSARKRRQTHYTPPPWPMAPAARLINRGGRAPPVTHWLFNKNPLGLPEAQTRVARAASDVMYTAGITTGIGVALLVIGALAFVELTAAEMLLGFHGLIGSTVALVAVAYLIYYRRLRTYLANANPSANKP